MRELELQKQQQSVFGNRSQSRGGNQSASRYGYDQSNWTERSNAKSEAKNGGRPKVLANQRKEALFTSTKKKANQGGYDTLEKSRRTGRTPGSSTGEDDDYPDVEIVENYTLTKSTSGGNPANMILRMQADIERRKIKQDAKKRMQELETKKKMSQLFKPKINKDYLKDRKTS